MRWLERVARAVTRAMDSLVHRVYGWRWNPLHQSGALAVWLLIVLTVTGLYLILLYRVGAPAQSVQRMVDDPWLGSWMRSLHRYATDAFVIAAVVHAVRLLGQAREWGTRARAWMSGVILLGIGMACALTGFVMAWDTFGLRLAVLGASLFDVLPVFSEPISRIFGGDRPIPGAFFFLNLFVHIALPLALGAGLWLHVSKVARPVLSPPSGVKWGVTAALTAASVIAPAPLGPAANPLFLPEHTPVDLIVAWWLPLAEHVSPVTVWLVLAAFTIGVLAIPRFSRRRRVNSWAPSVVDPRLCTGCDQCTQDCPWEAITMVARTDDRPTLVALVDPARCVSCGICAGSCAPMGVGPPGRTGRDQLAQLRASLAPMSESLTGAASVEEPFFGATRRAASADQQVIVVCCSQVSVAARAGLTAAGARIHDVPCVGALHSSVVELMIRQGAPGVLVAGCPPRDCVGREGPKWLEQRFFHDREAELQSRVDRHRVRVATLAVGLEREALAEFEAFQRDVHALGLQSAERDIDLRDFCEAEAAAGVSS